MWRMSKLSSKMGWVMTRGRFWIRCGGDMGSTEEAPHSGCPIGRAFFDRWGFSSSHPSQKTLHTKWAIKANTTIMNPVIQIRKLAVSLGDSISFLSMAPCILPRSVAELCSAARVGHPPYVSRGKGKGRDVVLRPFLVGVGGAGESPVTPQV